MNDLFFHPKLVHLPMALAVLVPLFASGLALAWWRGWLPQRAWWIAVAMQALLVGSSIAALRSGEADEHRVEALVGEAPIEAHEEAAEQFTLVAGVTAVVMLTAGLLGGRLAPFAVGLSLVGSLAGLALGVRTGQAGGELVYVHGAADAHTTGRSDARPGERASGERATGEREDHDDAADEH